MNRCLLIAVCFLFSLSGFSQVVKPGKAFTDVAVVKDKVVFLKEIFDNSRFSEATNYLAVKEWGKENYGKEPFISSVKCDDIVHSVFAKSKIQLILPIDSKTVREKVVMTYCINVFFTKGKCVFEVSDISYQYDNPQNIKSLSRSLSGEDMISDLALRIDDELSEIRLNTKRGTIFFMNELVAGLEKKFGMPESRSAF